MKLVFATHNVHKAAEVARILAAQPGPTGPVELVTLAELGFHEDPPETRDTFAGNALQKARFVYERTGLPCVADDSGIEVDALGGRPGVHSKRYAPEQTADANNRKLLEALGDVPEADRTARFRCVIAVVGLGPDRTAEGRCEGRIGQHPRGEGGFGYDPLFWPDEAPGVTMAELTMEQKNAISHRGRAFQQLPQLLAR